MEEAKGIPSRGFLGDLSQLPEGLIDFVIQRHLAEKAGPHYDVRFGTPDTGLYSWATKHELPEPGARRALFQQPLHTHEYGSFEGEIPSGYGKGKVKTHRKGKILITSASPEKIEFTTADKKHPERFVLLRPKTWQDKDWLLVNRTPTEKVPYEKVRYKRIPADKVDGAISQMQQGDSLERKLDGASSLVKLLSDGVELVSYRTSKQTNRPILHTERFFGGAGKMPIPKELVGSVLKGELYGKRDGEVIPPQELGGILNASLEEALNKQRANNVTLQNMLYDIQQYGKQHVDWHETPRLARREMLNKVLQHLPQDKFHLSEAATTQPEAQQLWNDVQQQGYSPGNEGVVFWPLHGVPSKSKLLEDRDVYLTGVFPGEGKYLNRGIGGFTYSNEPGGETVGRLGTGLSDEMREDAYRVPDEYIGRVARIQSQHQYPSGAWRAPSLIALHEDYPATDKQARHTLITGYSGSGKSTYAKRLGDETGMPVVSLDDDPAQVAFRKAHKPKDFLPGGSQRDTFVALRRASLLKALENPQASIIEGTQVAEHPDLFEGHDVRLVNPSKQQIIRQRLLRDLARGNVSSVDPNVDPEAARRKQMAEDLIRELKPYIDRIRKMPNVATVKQANPHRLILSLIGSASRRPQGKALATAAQHLLPSQADKLPISRRFFLQEAAALALANKENIDTAGQVASTVTKPFTPAGRSLVDASLEPVTQAFIAANPDMPKKLRMASGGLAAGFGGLGAYNVFNYLSRKRDKQSSSVLSQLGEKLAADNDVDAKEREDTEAKREKAHKKRKYLGPLEHAYVADSVGGKGLERAADRIQELGKDENYPHRKGLYNQAVIKTSPVNKYFGERVNRGAARLADNKAWRILAMLDPTADGNNEGLIGTLAGFGGEPGNIDNAKRRAAEAYAKFIRPHQAKLDPTAEPTTRNTPWHMGMQAQFVNQDADIAGNEYFRKTSPWHYWLNPVAKAGPLRELGHRASRRVLAGASSPDSQLGRIGMGLGTVATLGTLPLIMGGEEAQQKLRASAVANKIYPEEAEPELKEASCLYDIGTQLAVLKYA